MASTNQRNGSRSCGEKLIPVVLKEKGLLDLLNKLGSCFASVSLLQDGLLSGFNLGKIISRHGDNYGTKKSDFLKFRLKDVVMGSDGYLKSYWKRI
jgi:hypothetical protein